MLDRAWEMTWILREQGYMIDIIRCDHIGYLTYQDKFQVVATRFGIGQNENYSYRGWRIELRL